MWVKKYSGIGLIVLAVGCGASKIQQQNQPGIQTKAALPEVKLTQEVLIGNWTSECHVDERSDTFVVEYLNFDLEENSHFSTFYLDKECTQILYQQTVNGTYLFSARGNYSETRNQVAVTVGSSIAQGMFSTYQGFCGSRRWKLNEEQTFKDVTQCGLQKVMNSTLQARGNSGRTELTLKECPSNSTECYTSVYFRSANRR